MIPNWLPDGKGFSACWEKLRVIPWVAILEGCPQDKIHHAEGNVLIHTKMVLEELLNLPGFAALTERDKAIVWAACLLHDVAKPWTTKVEADGRVTAKGHSASGAKEARRILYEMGTDPLVREEICGLVRLHQLPFFCTEGTQREAERRAILASLTVRGNLLALVNDADGKGRYCEDKQKLQTNMELYLALCEELEILHGAYKFANPEARFSFCSNPEIDRHVHPPERYRCEVVLMCGFPGAGKSSWVRGNLPNHKLVSLDQIRKELKVDPTDPQSPVAAEGRERLKVFLRASQDCVWDATNVTRDHRSKIVALARDYGARIKIVQIEKPLPQVLRQNKSRPEKVPEEVIFKLLSKWQFPTLEEAHEILHVLE